jgi:hypothetical protein
MNPRAGLGALKKSFPYREWTPDCAFAQSVAYPYADWAIAVPYVCKMYVSSILQSRGLEMQLEYISHLTKCPAPYVRVHNMFRADIFTFVIDICELGSREGELICGAMIGLF